MYFILSISSNEVGKLLLIFNKKQFEVSYSIVSQEDTKTVIKVNYDGNDDLLETLMEELDTVDIEMNISTNTKDVKIKNVKIHADGKCEAFDNNYNVIREYCGDWEDMHKIILNNSDASTIFGDERLTL